MIEEEKEPVSEKYLMRYETTLEDVQSHKQ